MRANVDSYVTKREGGSGINCATKLLSSSFSIERWRLAMATVPDFIAENVHSWLDALATAKHVDTMVC
jgi:hypothetical protein